MIEFIGSIRARRRCPFVYFLVIGRYLYIGETQDIPVSRWADHLRAEGSFSERMRDADEEMLSECRAIQAFGYYCRRIAEEVPALQHRPVTQYVEHQIHVLAACHNTIGSQFSIISDTTRTAVAHCKFKWANDLAEMVTTRFAQDVQLNVAIK